jgi:choice-of-anchor A domain-containing protein
MRNFGVSIVATAFMLMANSVMATTSLNDVTSYNAFIFNNADSQGTVGGALAAGGNVTLHNNGINGTSNDGYALVVGGSLTKEWANISGKTWVGGSKSAPQWDSYSNYAASGTPAPINFAAAKADLSALSDTFAGAATTGTAAYAYSGVTFTGSNSSVEYIDLIGSQFSAINNATFNTFAAGSTIILNISGLSGGLTNMSLSTGNNYNLVLNYYEATSLYFNDVNIAATILAPNATITGGNGTITGTVIANNWNSSVTLAAGHADFSNIVTAPVPEPSTYAMLLAGLLLIGAASRRKISLRNAGVNAR